MKNFIGIDNGVTGTIGIISPKGIKFFETPVFKQQNYTKKKGNITRIDFCELYFLLRMYTPNDTKIIIERPLLNSTRLKASISAARSLEATLNVIENLELPYEYIDSKEWQRKLLPKGITGSPELKKASRDIGIRKYPQFSELIKKHKDADGILIAEFCMLKYKI